MGQLEIISKNIDRIYISVTYVGDHKREIDTIIDTGATSSYIGINYIKTLIKKFDKNIIT
jgi:hypothetical protein